MLTIKQLTGLVMEQAYEKKFGTKPEEINTMEKIAMIHSEVSEALEAYRHKNMDGKDGFGEELADVMIRVIHLAGIHGVDLEKNILDKIDFNKNREWKWEEYNETHVQ